MGINVTCQIDLFHQTCLSYQTGWNDQIRQSCQTSAPRFGI
jgi:hypothetical protein